MQWFDVLDWGIEGQGWRDTEAPFDRLPAKAKGVVPEPVWNLSRSATGMYASFRTNATEIHARWQLKSSHLGEANFPVAAFSGLDLYVDDGGTWRWAAATHKLESQTPEVCVIEGMAGDLRDFRLYLPMRNAVLKLEVGVPDEADFTPVAPSSEKPLVFYGTSILHGAYASHAGMVHSSILGRRLRQPVINLGFSGNGKMEIALADLLAEVDASVYILDTLPNMGLNLVEERAEAFVRHLRALRPDVPIVLVEDRPLGNYWIKPAVKQTHEAKWQRFREIYDGLVGEGMGDLHYVPGRDLFGTDSEGSLDSSHPSDLGFMRMAEILDPVLRPLVAQRG
jgi:lysophospholipase L1-like esterase